VRAATVTLLIAGALQAACDGRYKRALVFLAAAPAGAVAAGRVKRRGGKP